jgi:hypothetical protein
MRLPALVLAAGLALGARNADARSERTLAYQRDQAWPAAVRFIRVDAKLKVTEKDADAGYVLFEYVEEKRTFRGSLELVEVEKDHRKLITFVMQIEDRPTWVEVELLTKLERKLREELGSPSPAPTPPKKKDEGKDEPKPGDKPNDKPADKPKDDGPPVSDTP